MRLNANYCGYFRFPLQFYCFLLVFHKLFRILWEFILFIFKKKFKNFTIKIKKKKFFFFFFDIFKVRGVNKISKFSLIQFLFAWKSWCYGLLKNANFGKCRMIDKSKIRWSAQKFKRKSKVGLILNKTTIIPLLSNNQHNNSSSRNRLKMKTNLF